MLPVLPRSIRYGQRLLLLTGLLSLPGAAGAQTTPAPPLPEAPAAARGTAPGTAPGTAVPGTATPSAVVLPIVNGRPYRKPSAREAALAYRKDVIGARPFLSAGVRSGFEQIRTRPTGWGQDFPGYLQRYGSAYGEAAINNSVRYGMGSLLHEDVRYLNCHKCSPSKKLANAVLAEFTARHGNDGHRVFSPTPIVANFSGPLVAYSAWYPPGYGPDDAARHSSLGFATRIGFRVVREFLLDRDHPGRRTDPAGAHSQPDPTP